MPFNLMSKSFQSQIDPFIQYFPRPIIKHSSKDQQKDLQSILKRK